MHPSTEGSEFYFLSTSPPPSPPSTPSLTRRLSVVGESLNVDGGVVNAVHITAHFMLQRGQLSYMHALVCVLLAPTAAPPTRQPRQPWGRKIRGYG